MPSKLELENELSDLKKELTKERKTREELVDRLVEMVDDRAEYASGTVRIADINSLLSDVEGLVPTIEVTLKVRFQRAEVPTKEDIEEWWDDQVWHGEDARPCKSIGEDYQILEAKAVRV